MDAAEVVVVPDDPVAVVAQVEAKVETRTVEDVGPMAHGDLPAANRYRRQVSILLYTAGQSETGHHTGHK